MIFTIDTDKKTILLHENVELGELMFCLSDMFPNSYNDYTILSVSSEITANQYKIDSNYTVNTTN